MAGRICESTSVWSVAEAPADVSYEFGLSIVDCGYGFRGHLLENLTVKFEA
jgi:hypothetical protein